MARAQRHHHVDEFALGGDFNTQVYDALRKSPWWALSLAFHTLLGLALSLLHTPVPAPERKPAVSIRPAADAPEELEPETPPEPVEAVRPDELEVPTPVLREHPLPEQPQTDSDQDAEEISGETAGDANAPFEGPSTNNDMGTGPGGGGAWPGRGGRRDRGAGTRGGRVKEDAVLHGLRWLAAHQSEDGGWEAAGFERWCDGRLNEGLRPDGPGQPIYDSGVTGLALCAFLGAGYTHRGEHEFARTVRRGLAYLKHVQDPEGCFGPRGSQHFIYNHATAALAMVEAYGMTESPTFKGPAQRALDFIGLARNPYFVWRYGVKPGDNDTSVMGWMMMALKSARVINQDALRRGRPAPLEFDEGAFEGIRSWLDRMTDPDHGRVGYDSRGSGPARPQALVDRFPAQKSESMTAVALLARIFLEEDPRRSGPLQKAIALCLRLPPVWDATDGSIDMYYWYYATLGLYQVGGAAWAEWDRALQASVVAHQRADGTYCGFKGSWDPLDPWGPDGGRVYSTAILTMCLEAHYRYDRVVGTK